MNIEQALELFQKSIEISAQFDKDKARVRRKVTAFNLLEQYISTKEIEVIELSAELKKKQDKIDYLIAMLICSGQSYRSICNSLNTDFTFKELKKMTLKLQNKVNSRRLKTAIQRKRIYNEVKKTDNKLEATLKIKDYPTNSKLHILKEEIIKLCQ